MEQKKVKPTVNTQKKVNKPQRTSPAAPCKPCQPCQGGETKSQKRPLKG